nr:ABC transporter ATP-binding protein [uncultured Caproiciproducens sp.]
MSEICLQNVTKIYDQKKHVLENLNLGIADGSFTILLGPSGCGKTTMLRIIAGLENVTQGKVYIGGEEVTEKAPAKRGVAMVFQNYAIYPHMNVRENVEFGLKNMGVAQQKRREISENVLNMVGLESESLNKPSKLSGGQRQRIALARAISKNPRVFLMDEPLSNLDAKLRMQMRSELIQLHQKLKTTFVFVTHDQTEAMTMGDSIIVIHNGTIMQQGAPSDIYGNPDNVFVAQFIGDPGMNIIELKDSGCFVGFRPRAAAIQKPEDFEGVTVTGRVFTREYLGEEILYSVKTNDGVIAIRATDSLFDFDEKVSFYIPKSKLFYFDRNQNREVNAGVCESLYGEVMRYVS